MKILVVGVRSSSNVVTLLAEDVFPTREDALAAVRNMAGAGSIDLTGLELFLVDLDAATPVLVLQTPPAPEASAPAAVFAEPPAPAPWEPLVEEPWPPIAGLDATETEVVVAEEPLLEEADSLAEQAIPAPEAVFEPSSTEPGDAAAGAPTEESDVLAGTGLEPGADTELETAPAVEPLVESEVAHPAGTAEESASLTEGFVAPLGVTAATDETTGVVTPEPEPRSLEHPAWAPAGEPEPEPKPLAATIPYEPTGELDIAAYTCKDCVYSNTCPKAGESSPSECGTFQWRSL